ncbi:MAG: IS4 family transposase, partial [Deltaproteobacteria bacterium]|nr:IS4 family transposase [Deltaproteobacteria bacterium]
MTDWEQLMAEDWAIIEGMLPDGWEDKAEELGAWERVRAFRSKEVLLRTLLIHVALGCSLKETAVRASEADFADVSSVAVFKRLKKCGEWLRWLALGVMEKWLVPSRQALSCVDLPLKIVDATTVQEPGATGTSWRVHYAIRLSSLACDEFKVTSPKEGESLEHFSVTPGDIVLGDRGYAYRGQIAYVVGKGGNVVVRTGLTNLPTYDSLGRCFNVLARARRLKNGEVGDWEVLFEHEGTLVKGRICAVRKSLAARKAARARCLRENSRKGRKVKPQTVEAADYVIVFTTLDRGFSAEMVMEIYRCRWQVELAFKRLKSLLGLGSL